MFKFINKIKKVSRRIYHNGEKIDDLRDSTEKQLKRQNLKIDELLDTLIELHELNDVQHENEELVKSIMVLWEFVKLTSKYIGGGSQENFQLMKQIEILENKIHEQLAESKITLISDVNLKFNGKKHEVISTFKTSDDLIEHGKIKRIIEEGFLYKGKIIKKAKVEVYIK